ncbi:MAG: aminoglycoside adenylyltransferase domain-containing protein [Janthinobacterium lividum]
MDSKWLGSNYNLSYIILDLCRILCTIVQHPTGSKTIAATWVKNEFGSQWIDLIEAAEQWQQHKKIAPEEEVILFIKFVIEEVSKTQLYCQNFKNATSL